MDESKDGIKEVQVRFVSKLEIGVPDNSFAVPVTLARYGLSEIVNHFLEEDNQRPFDFLINNQFLRSTISKYLIKTGVTGEAGLTVEVVEAVSAPDSEEGQTHPDWVASTATISDRLIVSGCYDGVVRVFAQKEGSALNVRDATALGMGHTNAVKAVACFDRTHESDSATDMVVSVSKDRTARLWKYTAKQEALHCAAVCSGHTNSVETVVTSGQRFATGGWDTNVLMWDSAEILANADNSGTTKKQKSSSSSNTTCVATGTPLAELEGHTQCVSAMVWPHPLALYSGSWDCSIRLWDTPTGTCSSTWHGNKQISSLSFSVNANLLASAHCDRSVRIWDPRSKDGEVQKLQLRSHKEWVTDVAFAPNTAHMLASTSHDGTVKIWDTRSTVPLHTITTHTDKVLSVSWYSDTQLVSGAADCKLLTHTFAASS